MKTILPKRMQTRRAGYLALATLFLISILSFSFFKLSPKTEALTASSDPGTAAQDATGTVSWASPTNARITDTVYSSVTGTASSTATTNYLQLTNFGFTIPAGSTINGISVTFDRYKVASGTASATDNSIAIIKGGSATGTDHSTGATWFSGLATRSDSFGGSSDLWGASWATTDINASNFGIELKANIISPASAGIIEMDGTSITITYSPSNSAPAAPTLSTPSSGATGVSTAPLFQLRTTDADNDYLRYDIAVYQSDCSTLVRDIDESSSQTGWSGQDQQTATAYTGNSVITSSTMANHTYQSSFLSGGTTYCWKARAIDPGGSNTFGSYAATQLFSTSSNSTPAAPTLLSPASGATAQSTSPLLQVKTTDADSDYLRYKILLYNSDCSTGLQTFDETSSQTGWSGQDQQTGTAHTGSTTLPGSTAANYGLAVLSANTTYCWKAAAIDPGGTNTFSSYSSTQLFTTGSATSQSQVTGGANITGGSIIR